jgi:micrococcal nuclease
VYEYKTKVTRVVDADTMDLDVRLGFKVVVQERFRLHGLNAPETFGPKASQAGKSAKAYVESWLATWCVGNEVVIRSSKPLSTDKYGRWLAVVSSPGGKTLNQDMLAEGHAVEYLP